MRERRAALLEIVGESPPMTARQTFYQATMRGIVERTEASYDKIKRQLVALRMTGALPFEWIADHTRWPRRPRTFDTPADALSETARFYRKSLWSQATERVEIWLEKAALAGVVVEVTYESDVPLMVTRGYPSLTFLASAAETIVDNARPTFIYHLGDFDPSGQDAARVVEERLRSLARGTDILFERLAVTPKQIRELDLPTRLTKTSDSRAKHFGSVSVELDAVARQRRYRTPSAAPSTPGDESRGGVRAQVAGARGLDFRAGGSAMTIRTIPPAPSPRARDDEAQHTAGATFAEAVVAALSGKTRASFKPSRRKRDPDDKDDDVRRRRETARWLWAQREPLAGSIAETYLRKARSYGGSLPATLGFLRPFKDYPPSLIAAFAMPEEAKPGVLRAPLDVDAVQLIALKPDGSGKAGVKVQKRTIGAHKGVPIVVAPPNDLLAVSIHEGVEDALSAHEATGLGAWASGGASFLSELANAIPAYVECVTVVAHRDEAGRNGARTLARRLVARGFQVLLHGGA
jgi:hypothetical protein